MSTRTIDAQDIKARDLLVVYDQARVEWISHLDEFMVWIKLHGYTRTFCWSKWQGVTIIRGDQP